MTRIRIAAGEATSSADGTALSALTERRASYVHRAVLMPLICLLILCLWGFSESVVKDGGPAGIGLDGDFAMFYTASSMLEKGANPYVHTRLYRQEVAVLRRDNVPTYTDPAWVRVGNPPLFFWALEPLTRFPFWDTAWFWTAGLACASAAGGWILLAAADWTRRTRPLLTFLAIPQVVLGYFNGNTIPIAFLGFALGVRWSRSRPFLAGAVSCVAWLKPSVVIPLVALVVLFHATRQKRMAAGFLVATSGLAVLNVVLAGPVRLMEWIQGLVSYSHDMASQPEIASLAGMYIHWASPALQTDLRAVFLVAAVALTAAWWWTHRTFQPSMLSTGWLWFAWFLATPYAHINDVILLTPPILALFGTNGRNAARPLAIPILYLLVLGVLPAPPDVPITLEPLELLAAGVCLAIAARRQSYRDAAVTDQHIDSQPVLGVG